MNDLQINDILRGKKESNDFILNYFIKIKNPKYICNFVYFEQQGICFMS